MQARGTVLFIRNIQVYTENTAKGISFCILPADFSDPMDVFLPFQ